MASHDEVDANAPPNDYAAGEEQADNIEPCLPYLPNEMKQAVFHAAADEPQIFYLDITHDKGIVLTRSDLQGFLLACKLSRTMFIKNKKRIEFGGQVHWVNPERDIFYLVSDSEHSSWGRVRMYMGFGLLEPEKPVRKQDRSFMRNIAVDLGYLRNTSEDRDLSIARLCTIFNAAKELHVLVPRGQPPLTTLTWVSETLRQEELRRTHNVSWPGWDPECWFPVKYRFTKVYQAIAQDRRGFVGPKVIGHQAK
ncbi:hypothetical protein B0H66DRAFT_610832 [Apodospora peruviana]|uniref:Uncharacterized protein n=1 Tax=Apodospora peruviana TaxID=516989 RepID=A0AAE0IRE8_9PEZI|nr:hypothetical protein B0H66DRAFT_610832 [Apodospora peruviana]